MVCVSVLSPADRAGPGIRCKQVVGAPFTPTLHSSGVGVKLSRSVYTAAFPLADIRPSTLSTFFCSISPQKVYCGLS